MLKPLSFVLICLSAAGINAAAAQCPASSPLAINVVTATESRCQASGAATVLVSGGTAPYTFSIISGPVLTPPQSSNILQSLAAGSYVVQVTDNCNTSVTKSFSVTGSYAVPQLVTTLQSPSCRGGSDGSLQIDVSNGRPPFMYSLVSPSPVTTGPQAGNVFTGLPAGTYTSRVTDSCGNFQTRTVTILDGSTGTLSVYSGLLQYEGCDSFSLPYSIYVTTAAANFKPPYTATLKKPDNSTITHVFNAGAATGFITDTFHFRYRHTAGVNENITLSASNNCGASGSYVYNLNQDLDMAAMAAPLTGCNSQYAYSVDLNKDNNGSPSRVHCSTISYTLLSPAGGVLATQINNSFFSGYPPGAGYKVIRQDCCKTDTLIFTWAAVAPLKISFYTFYPNDVCKEGVTSLMLFFNNSTQGNIVVASGPSSVSFADGTVHNYTYPDTIKNQPFNPYGLSLDYFSAGTWKLYAIDTCGRKDSITFTVAAAQLRHSVFSATLVRGCTGANKILLNAVSNAGASSIYPDAVINVSQLKTTNVTASPFTDSAVNLSSGTYYVGYSYKSRFTTVYLNGMSGYSCDIISDTIVIPAYTQPLFDPSAAVAICGSSRQVALLPDTTRGLPPYVYQVIAGPVTTAAQASPVFPGLPAGTYTFLVADACANSYSRSLSVDTLAVPGIVTTGNTCAGGAAVFTLPASPFYSYVWQRPDGSTSTGNAITVNPVTSSDTGTYRIAVTSTVGGCTNTTNKTVVLGYCFALPVTLLNFTGTREDGSIRLHWQSADEVNTGRYVVQSSRDGSVFLPLQTVFATGLAMNTYTATDNRPPPGFVCYRLQIVDKDGNTAYSKTISFNNGIVPTPNVYPRLITSEAAITLSYPRTTSAAFVQVVGIDGKVWQTRPVASGSTATTIDTSRLAKGCYMVVFINNGTAIAMQVLKE